MNDYIVFDTYAWIAYFSAAEFSEVVRKHLESSECITPTIVLVELKRKFLQLHESGLETQEKTKQKIEFVKNKSMLVSLDSDIAELSGDIYYNMRKNIKDWPIADSIVLATANLHNAKILTGDPHFKGMENVIFLG